MHLRWPEGDGANGTDDSLERLTSERIVHVTAGARCTPPEQSVAFLGHIACDLEAMADCDLMLYQAGADPHVGDPLGGFLTTQELLLRDQRVFGGLRERKIPVAWNLPGGYQKPMAKVVAIHEGTFAAQFEVASG